MRISTRWRLSTTIYLGAWAGVLGLATFGMLRSFAADTHRGSESDTQETAALADDVDYKIDPAKVMGAKSCIKCHKAEYAQWLKTVHYRNPERLKTKAALTYAKRMGIAADRLTKDSMCVSCHATPQKQESGEIIAVSGVSCESCHGPSGGDPGWLNRHAVYGKEGTKRNQETADHRKERLEFCAKNGKLGPRELYGLARKCLSCHIVGNEKLLNVGQHKAGSANFEFASWTNGEVRHNFHENQGMNAEVSSLWLNPVGAEAGEMRKARNRQRVMYVVGILAELETVLRHRANATKAGPFTTALGGRIGTLAGKLPGLAAVAPVQEIKDMSLLVPTLIGRAFAVQEGDKKYFNEQADKVAKAAQGFLKNNDGSKLMNLDAMIPKSHYSKDYKE